jgi:hypothetical protein
MSTRPAPWHRAFWADGRDGFRAGWVLGLNLACMGVGVAVVVLSDSVVAWLAMLYFVALGWILRPHTFTNSRTPEPSESNSDG